MPLRRPKEGPAHSEGKAGGQELPIKGRADVAKIPPASAELQDRAEKKIRSARGHAAVSNHAERHKAPNKQDRCKKERLDRRRARITREGSTR